MTNYLPLLSCLLLALVSLSLSADVFVSIDCGSSTSYKDENGIAWAGDDKYVETGESRSVSSSNAFSHVADTLRVFTNKTKNCYNIDSVKRGRVLIRATFHYGNYDGKSSPPSFAVHFDGNEWGKVKTLPSQPVVVELTYVMRRDSISVCVARMDSEHSPFISALEIRSLELSMYSAVDVNYPLFTRKRLAFGTNETIRFPDDPYDRLWRQNVYTNGTINVSCDALLSNAMLTLDDYPPPAVLKAAATAPTPNSTMHFLMAFPTHVPTFINFYFSEVTLLKPNQTRSFYIFKDNLPFSPLIIPPYQNCTEMSVSNLTVFSKTTFSLVPAQNSTLPPLINAMEIFAIGKSPLNDGTNNKDVQGLASLQEAFSFLQEWSGDPCLPSGYEWDWVGCNIDAIPRVTALYLSGYGLTGLLPDFSSMDALQTIDLHNNNLRGDIPDFLGTLPDLQILNLENNQLNGSIPASLTAKKGLLLRVPVGGNPGLCTSNTSCRIPAASTNSSMREKKKILEIVCATIISFIIVLQYS